MWNRLLAIVGAVACAGCLVGCGGSGSASSGTSITGRVVAPASLTRAASRAADELTAVAGATIEVVDLATGQVVATGTTQADGTYSVSGVAPGKNYEVRVTKAVAGGTLQMKTVVSPDAGTNSGRDVSPTSTVAAIAVEVRLQNASSDPQLLVELKKSALEVIASDLAKSVTQAPGAATLMNQDQLRASAQQTLATAIPNGALLGSFTGTDSKGTRAGSLAGVFVNGQFVMTFYACEANGTPDYVILMKGAIDSSGNVTGVSLDGSVQIAGTFTSGSGCGTWTSTDGNGTGTWKLQSVSASKSYAGLYIGRHTSDAGDRLFGIAVLEDRTAWVFEGPALSATPAAGDLLPQPVTAGTLAEDNTLRLTLSYQDGPNKQTAAVEGAINSDGSASGTFNVTGGLVGTWQASRVNMDSIAHRAVNDMPPVPPSI